MAAPKAVILACAGLALTSAERRLFSASNPFGLILFARNIDSPTQVMALTQEFRACVGRADAPVLIDQEGGRVARLRPPHWDAFPAAAEFGKLYERDPARGIAAAKLLGRMLAAQLLPLGITVNCAPVLDLLRPETTVAIGDRAFSADPHTVAVLARAVCDGLRVGGVLPVIKHMPGHGRATADSHEILPEVAVSAAELGAQDLVPFIELRDMPVAMTAHILYPAYDRNCCATLSPEVIGRVIRREIGFNGLLLSDDLTMKALSGDRAELAAAALAAGCDVALYCKHDVAEMTAILARVADLGEAAQQRWQKARDWLKPMDLYCPRVVRAEFTQYFPTFASNGRADADA